jgi:hypothetical protein
MEGSDAGTETLDGETFPPSEIMGWSPGKYGQGELLPPLPVREELPQPMIDRETEET